LQGYRRHLDWHAQRKDPSRGWPDKVDGPNLGAFVDGAFGIRFTTFDERADPIEMPDAARNVVAFADPIGRDVFRIRPDLSSASRLESGDAAPMQKVVRLTLRPGSQETFERALRPIAQQRHRLDYAMYERVSGGSQPEYVLIVQLAGWRDLASGVDEPAQNVVQAAGATLDRVEAEVWSYRPELSYVPRRPR
jgi:hypothetical protein